MPQQIPIIIKEHKCKSCKIEKPHVFFISINGKINDICKKCKKLLVLYK